MVAMVLMDHGYGQCAAKPTMSLSLWVFIIHSLDLYDDLLCGGSFLDGGRVTF